MKPKTISIILSTLFLLLFVVGCDDKKEEPHLTSINGTWKCIGFGDTKGKLVKEIEPKLFEGRDVGYYIMTFKEDGTFKGKSTIKLSGKYRINKNEIRFFELSDSFNNKIGELGNGNEFRLFFQLCDKFAIKQGKLYLFYSENECLLFNHIK